MKIYTKVRSEEINEYLEKIEKPRIYKRLKYPYSSLDFRSFEILIYLLYEEEIKSGIYKGLYDRAHLMKAVGEKGRDILLTNEGKYEGVIQCKNYQDRLDKGKVAREIIKFALYYMKDNNLITNLDRFSYYFIASSGFNDDALELLTNFNKLIVEEKKLKKWTESVIKKVSSLKDLNYDTIQMELINILKRLNVEYVIGEDITLRLKKFPNILTYCFEIETVISQNSIEDILDKKLKSVKVIEPIDKTPNPNDERIPFLEALIRNYTIKYYKEEENKCSIKNIIYNLILKINRYRPRFQEKFAPNHIVKFTSIIRYYFNLIPNRFNIKVENEEIIYEKINNRTPYIHAGDLAYAIHKKYNDDYQRDNILIDNVRQKYGTIIIGNYREIKVEDEFKKKPFNEYLALLIDEKIIKTTGPYTGSDCLEIYNITNLRRLRDFIEVYSLEEIIASLTT